jgi:hypothetical protein
VFSKYDWKGHDEIPVDNPVLMDLPESGTQSTYFDVEIIAQTEVNETNTFRSCGKECHLCRSIKHEN